MIAAKLSQRTQQALSRMQQLAGQSGRLYRRRLRYVATVLRDQRWLASRFAGDVVTATNHLQDCYFADLSGYVTLQKLLRIYQELPRSTWQQYRYNLRALELLYDRPELAESASHVSVRAHVRRIDGRQHESPDVEYRRLAGELKEIERRRRQLRRRLRELQSLLHVS